MKYLILTLISLFTLNINAQDRDTFTICKNTQIYTEYNSHSREVTLRSDLGFLHESDLIHKIRAIDNVITTASNPYKMDILMSNDFIPAIFTENLLDTLSVYLCDQLFERTPTGLKQDTIYDYGTHTPKEIDSLEKEGHIVINNFRTLSISTGTTLFTTVQYDTIEIEGLAIYLSNEDFKNGKVFELLPTIKTVVRCRNCFTQTYYYNGFKFTANGTLKAKQLKKVENSSIWGIQYLYEWQDIDLTKYKEFIFIEKPK